MSAPRTTIWSISGVTRTKHSIFKQYLQWWLPHVVHSYGNACILDGFAGPGEYIEGDYGSPLIALNTLYTTLPPTQHHKVQLFCIEKSQRRTTHLRKLIAKAYPQFTAQKNRLYRISQSMFEATVDAYLHELQPFNENIIPTLAFIDPFGFKDIPFVLLTNLMKQTNCDLLLTFMYEEINRFLTHPHKSIQHHFDRLFGTDQWRLLTTYENREDLICNLYIQQIKQATNVKYACKFRMRNGNNGTDYFLFFFTSHLDHLTQMKHIFWEIDPRFGSNFNENDQHALQFTLFDPDYTQYREALVQQFSNRIIEIVNLDEYVLAETIFCKHRYKEYLLKPLEQASLITVLTEGAQRQTGHYTEQDRIHFHS